MGAVGKKASANSWILLPKLSSPRVRGRKEKFTELIISPFLFFHFLLFPPFLPSPSSFPSSIQDEDPYVRKTAAVCVAKLHDINSQLVEDQGFLDLLKDLLSDSIPMVVANAVAALAEIGEVSPAGRFLLVLFCHILCYFCEQLMPFFLAFTHTPSASELTDLDMATISKLLTALNECTEWGQVFILDSLASYQPKDEREAQNICERVTPRLSHANAAVVLSAVKVFMMFV